MNETEAPAEKSQQPKGPPIYEGDAMKIVDEQYANPEIFENTGDIHFDKGRFLFNNGHAKHEMGPYLIQLVTEYGAIPYRIQKRGRKGEYDVWIGMEPAELFRWVKDQMSVGNFSDLMVDRTQSLVDNLPIGWLRKKFDALLAKRVQDKPLSDVLFAFRQQVEQVPSPDSYVTIIQGSIELGKYELARKHLLLFKKALFNMNRQYAAAASFYSRFYGFLDHPGVSRRMHTTERLQFELEMNGKAYDVTKAVVLGAREWMLASSNFEQQLDELDPPQVATPAETE